jgi:hypothetical protein
MERDDGLTDKVISVVDWFETPLEGPIYDGLDAKLSIEVRDFGRVQRTMVIRTWIDGAPVTTMVSFEKFIDAFDAMRQRMMPSDWDDALASLVGNTTEKGGQP